MGLISLVKKASMSLGSILLACNIGCNSSFHANLEKKSLGQSISLEQELEKSAESVPAEPRKLKKWEYPVNILGGILLTNTNHECWHAIAGLIQGGELIEFKRYPHIRHNGNFEGAFYKFDPKSVAHLSPQEKSLINIAGPLSNIALSELIDYNLRSGKVSEGYQPFWATTSLISRLLLCTNALKPYIIGRGDFVTFERKAGVPKEVMTGLVGLYTALSAKKIAKEFRVALGKDIYSVKKQKGRVDLVPTNDGLNVSYTLNF